MKKFSKKMIAGLLSGAVVASTCFNSIFASASVINNHVVSGSNFSYTVITEKVTYNNNPNSIKMTIHVTNNPGISLLGFYVQYSGNCEVKDAAVSYGADFSNPNPETNCVIFNWMSANDYSGDLDFIAWFEEEDSNGNDATDPIDLNISVGMSCYKSIAENLEDSADSDTPSDTTISVTPTTEVMLGDVNDNDSIDQLDAQTTLSIVSHNNSLVASGVAGYTNGQISVNTLNEKMGLHIDNWYNKFKKLKCAEIADVDFDGYITENDAYDILTYHSQMAAGNLNMDSVIGKPIYINI